MASRPSYTLTLLPSYTLVPALRLGRCRLQPLLLPLILVVRDHVGLGHGLRAHDLLLRDLEHLPDLAVRNRRRVVDPEVLLVRQPLAAPAELVLDERRRPARVEVEDKVVEGPREAVHLGVLAHVDLPAPLAVAHGVRVDHDG